MYQTKLVYSCWFLVDLEFGTENRVQDGESVDLRFMIYDFRLIIFLWPQHSLWLKQQC
jgi:hypothetical protein